LTKVNVPIK
jgi:hypothetical protein